MATGTCARPECGKPFFAAPRVRGHKRFCSPNCKKVVWQRTKYNEDEKYAEMRRAHNRAYWNGLIGSKYSRRLLQMRRASAMKRRRNRKEAFSGTV